MSGAISGNLIQYILDKKRLRHKRRLEFIDSWRSILKISSKYSEIILEPSYEILEGLISQKIAATVREKVKTTEDKISQLNFEFEVHGDYAVNLGLDELYESASDEDTINLPPYQDPLSDAQNEMTKYLIQILNQEINKLEKKWGLL